MLAGLPADLGVAAAAFIGTNVDNAVVTVAMVAAAPPERASRLVLGQATGFLVLALAAGATAIALFELSTRVIGLLGVVPLALGLRGLWALRHREGPSRTSTRAVGSGFTAAALVTIAAGGDNLAAYIPLFRVAGPTSVSATVFVFVVAEAVLSLLILRVGLHPRTRSAAVRVGELASPLLLCAVGGLVIWRAGTLTWLT
jgi:cadmium resistance protein CadD (predicted permease)